jgi:hypothetical protein
VHLNPSHNVRIGEKFRHRIRPALSCYYTQNSKRL